jgi:ribosomal protein S18 acetylase RimI-like enzyme
MTTFKTFITEKVNSKLFKKGFRQTKEILDGTYTLIATPGYMKLGQKLTSDQFRITAKTSQGLECGWVNFENIDDKLEALDLAIQPAHRRKGIATEMYKFAKELGNDIRPARLQTTMGKLFWKDKDHS